MLSTATSFDLQRPHPRQERATRGEGCPMRALTREVPTTFASGLTTADLGLADVALARLQHEGYVRCLREAGFEVLVLPPDEAFPDSCFVEDTAVRIDDDHLVLTRPGHPSRHGEVSAVEGNLRPRFARTSTLGDSAYLDGGDVLRAVVGGRPHFVIGLSGRTNAEGARQLGDVITACGYTSSVATVADGLHLKSGSSFLGDRVLCWASLEPIYRELGLDTLVVPDVEGYAANTVLANGRLLVASGFPATAALLRGNGYPVVEVDVSEFRKQDGGLSCLSILF